jgi:hypothetical protein
MGIAMGGFDEKDDYAYGQGDTQTAYRDGNNQRPLSNLDYDQGLHDGLQAHRELILRWLRANTCDEGDIEGTGLSDHVEADKIAEAIEAAEPEKWDAQPKKR